MFNFSYSVKFFELDPSSAETSLILVQVMTNVLNSDHNAFRKVKLVSNEPGTNLNDNVWCHLTKYIIN